MTTFFTPGNERNVPITGNLFKNKSTVGKNDENKTKNPYPSINIPKNGQPRNTNAPPAMNAAVPRPFLLKNLNVRRGPIVVVTPLRNKMLPMDNKPRSKKSITPSTSNSTPKLVKPMPISVEMGGRG